VQKIIDDTEAGHQLAQWLLATSKGDQAAFACLLRSHWSRVYGQALTYLKSAEWAQELTQDIFLKIWSARERLPEVEQFSDYLFIISRNELISALRKKGKEFSEQSFEPEELIWRPDLQLQHKELYVSILTLIDQLPPVRKKIFMMSRMEGKSYEEIALLHGISRNGVKDHIVKALNYLRTHLGRIDPKLLLLVLSQLFCVR
jgi:RNA polymerase sigma-70 factor (ECF subfamily)